MDYSQGEGTKRPRKRNKQSAKDSSKRRQGEVSDLGDDIDDVSDEERDDEMPAPGPSQRRAPASPSTVTPPRMIRMVYQNQVEPGTSPQQRLQTGQAMYGQSGLGQPSSVSHPSMQPVLQEPWQAIQYSPRAPMPPSYHPTHAAANPATSASTSATASHSIANPPSSVPSGATVYTAQERQHSQAPQAGERQNSSSSSSSPRK